MGSPDANGYRLPSETERELAYRLLDMKNDGLWEWCWAWYESDECIIRGESRYNTALDLYLERWSSRHPSTKSSTIGFRVLRSDGENYMQLERENSVVAGSGSPSFQIEVREAFENANITIAPIGWSRNGLFAYRTAWYNPAVPASGYSLVIFNTVTDEEIERIEISTDSPEPDFEFPNDEKIAETKNEWQEILTKYEIIGKIENPVKEIEKAGYSSFRDAAFKCWFDYEIIENSDSEFSNWKLIAEAAGKQKIVSSYRSFSDILFGKNIKGYYKSPYENRIIIIVTDVGNGFEGGMSVETKLYGCHLGVGFE